MNLDPSARKISVFDGKSRLFGASDENAYSGPSQPVSDGQKNTGKRILQNNANSFNNVIGGSYTDENKA
jgi:hypothetical protein